jgi:hypothetical protein
MHRGDGSTQPLQLFLVGCQEAAVRQVDGPYAVCAAAAVGLLLVLLGGACFLLLLKLLLLLGMCH